MKTVTLFLAFVIGCFALLRYAGAFDARASVTVEKQANVPAVDVGFHVELPATTPVLKRPTQPTRPTAQHVVARKPAKVWTCGDWRPLTQGHGNVQTCEWL